MSDELRVCQGRPVVVDSSVAFKWFDTTEPGADIAAHLLAAHARDEIAIVVPAHLPLEVANAVICRGAAVDTVTGVMDALWSADLLIAPLDASLLSRAAHIASAERLALYDAVFVSLAEVLDAELVTADRRQASASSRRVHLIG